MTSGTLAPDGVKLTRSPTYTAACCAALSVPLIDALLAHLPRSPSLVLSVGCGSGLLERLLLKNAGINLNLQGVEVTSAAVEHLPDKLCLWVLSTTAVHPEVQLASSLLFVYPRAPALVDAYLNAGIRRGVIESVIWLGPRCDWQEFNIVLQSHFRDSKRVLYEGATEQELLAVFTSPLCE